MTRVRTQAVKATSIWLKWKWSSLLAPAWEPQSTQVTRLSLISRPANVCTTSVPRMDRVPSSGWTGSRAVSLMRDTHGQSKQKREEGPTRPDRKKVRESLRSWELHAQFRWLILGLGFSRPDLPIHLFSSCCVYLAWVHVSHRSGQEPQALPASCTRLF